MTGAVERVQAILLHDAVKHQNKAVRIHFLDSLPTRPAVPGHPCFLVFSRYGEKTKKQANGRRRDVMYSRQLASVAVLTLPKSACTCKCRQCRRVSTLGKTGRSTDDFGRVCGWACRRGKAPNARNQDREAFWIASLSPDAANMSLLFDLVLDLMPRREKSIPRFESELQDSGAWF